MKKKTMRVATYYNNRDVRIEKRPIPKIGSGEILIKVHSSGICGSDVLEWYRIKKAPLVLGHEIAGEIAQVGKGVKEYKAGDRVFVSHHIPCNTCRYCLSGHHTACHTLHTTNYDPGGFAEYIRIPKLNVDCGVFILPDEVSFDEGAFVEPLACVIRAQRIAKLKPGQTVLILGSGISGLLHLLLAKALGAGKIFTTDTSEYRLKAAQQFGASDVIHASENVPARLRELNEGWLADLVIVCTGDFSAFKQALASVDKGGTVQFFAATDPGVEVPVPANEFWRNEMTITTSYGNSPSDAFTAIELIRNKRVPVLKMITHHLPLSKTAEGFRLVYEAKNSIKVIIHPQKSK